MAKIDKQKDFLTNLRLYMTLIIVITVSIGNGIAKLYNAHEITYLFYVGSALVLIFLFIFVLLAKKLHIETNKLEEIQ